MFAIPVIGWLFLIIFSFSTKNYNRRSFARSYWCGLIIAVILIAILLITGVGSGWLYEQASEIHRQFPELKMPIVIPTQRANDPMVYKVTPEPKVDVTPNVEQTKEPTLSYSGVTPEFKKTMGEYEAFIDSYIEFMEQYESSTSSLTQLAKYTELMMQYTETIEALDKIEDSNLSEADDQYFIEVQFRINQKLATFAAKQ